MQGILIEGIYSIGFHVDNGGNKKSIDYKNVSIYNSFRVLQNVK